MIKRNSKLQICSYFKILLNFSTLNKNLQIHKKVILYKHVYFRNSYYNLIYYIKGGNYDWFKKY